MDDPDTTLIIRSEHPLNAETLPGRLCAAMITAQRDMFVRNHGEIPNLTVDRHRLRVAGLVDTPLDLSVPELVARFAPRSVTAVLQCAGNRRAGLSAVRVAAGNPWGVGAIGNAVWTGVSLADVLAAAGAHRDAGLHVALAGCDLCEAEGEQFRFTTSIPMEKAVAGDVLLATAVNGEPLAPEHGSPLRAIVPGYIGARSPKWLASLTVQDQPSAVRSQARDYKLFPPDVRAETADWSEGRTMNEMPLNSAICEPVPDAPLRAGLNIMRGYAVSGRCDLARVEVSADGGESWIDAALEQDPAAPWGWTLWSARVDLSAGERLLIVRAWNTAGETQPVSPADTWNFKGYGNNAWHRVPVRVA